MWARSLSYYNDLIGDNDHNNNHKDIVLAVLLQTYEETRNNCRILQKY